MQSGLDVTDVGAVAQVKQSAHRGLTYAEAYRQCGSGHVLPSHGAVQSEFGGDNGRNGYEFMAVGDGAGYGDFFAAVHVRAQGNDEGILGHLKGFGSTLATRQRLGHVWKGHGVAAVFSFSR